MGHTLNSDWSMQEEARSEGEASFLSQGSGAKCIPTSLSSLTAYLVCLYRGVLAGLGVGRFVVELSPCPAQRI